MSVVTEARTWLSRKLAPGASTFIAGGATDREFANFDAMERSREKLEEFEGIYRRGGPVSSLIDTRALMIGGTGTDFNSNEDQETTALIDGELVTATEWLDDVFNDRDNLLVNILRDTYVYGDALGEITENTRGEFNDVLLINPKTMKPRWDAHGMIHQWEQTVEEGWNADTVTFPAREIAHFKTRTLGRRPVGLSMIEQNYDEIQRFANNQEAIQNWLGLHGFPKYHVKVGKEDGGQVVNDHELRVTRQRFRRFNETTNWVTGTDINIDNIDTSTTEIDGITEHDLMNLASGFRVPEELVGLGRGSTEATAKVKLQAFERDARAEQRALSDQFIRQIVRPVLRHYSPFPHDIDIELSFGDVVSDQTATAEWLTGMKEAYTINEGREKMGDGPVPDEANIDGNEPLGTSAGGGLSDLFGGGPVDAENQTADASATPQEGIPRPREQAAVVDEDGNEYYIVPAEMANGEG